MKAPENCMCSLSAAMTTSAKAFLRSVSDKGVILTPLR